MLSATAAAATSSGNTPEIKRRPVLRQPVPPTGPPSHSAARAYRRDVKKVSSSPVAKPPSYNTASTPSSSNTAPSSSTSSPGSVDQHARSPAPARQPWSSPVRRQPVTPGRPSTTSGQQVQPLKVNHALAMLLPVAEPQPSTTVPAVVLKSKRVPSLSSTSAASSRTTSPVKSKLSAAQQPNYATPTAASRERQRSRRPSDSPSTMSTGKVISRAESTASLRQEQRELKTAQHQHQPQHQQQHAVTRATPFFTPVSDSTRPRMRSTSRNSTISHGSAIAPIIDNLEAAAVAANIERMDKQRTTDYLRVVRRSERQARTHVLELADYFECTAAALSAPSSVESSPSKVMRGSEVNSPRAMSASPSKQSVVDVSHAVSVSPSKPSVVDISNDTAASPSKPSAAEISHAVLASPSKPSVYPTSAAVLPPIMLLDVTEAAPAYLFASTTKVNECETGAHAKATVEDESPFVAKERELTRAIEALAMGSPEKPESSVHPTGKSAGYLLDDSLQDRTLKVESILERLPVMISDEFDVMSADMARDLIAPVTRALTLELLIGTTCDAAHVVHITDAISQSSTRPLHASIDSTTISRGSMHNVGLGPKLRGRSLEELHRQMERTFGVSH